MAESYSAYTPGSGGKYHVNNRTIGANSVDQQVILHGEPYLAAYSITTASITIATANAHLLEIMAGSTLPVYLRSIRVYLSVLVTTAAIATWELWRLSSVGTGGTSITPAPLDTTDSASGATAKSLPSPGGTETTKLWSGTTSLEQTAPTAGASTLIVDLDFDDLFRTKVPRIAAGTSNGLALKWVSASTGASAIVTAQISEATF